MAIITIIAPILIGYLLESFPSAYILGRVWAKADLRREGDGHISATALTRYLGWKGLPPVVALDIGKGILAIYVASLFTSSQLVQVLAAYAAVIGHCWSIFLGFKGGLGGLISFSVLVSLAFRETWISVGFVLIFLLTTKKSSLATYLLPAIVSIVLLVEKASLIMVLFPIGVLVIHFLKRRLVQRKPVPAYKNEVFDDIRWFK